MNFSILCNVTKLSEHARDEKEKFASMRETIHLLPLEKSANAHFHGKIGAVQRLEYFTKHFLSLSLYFSR